MDGRHAVSIDSKVAFGRAVRAMRIERGVSQEELADRCSMSRATLSKVETGQADLRLSSVFRLAAGLDVAAADMLRRTEDIMLVPPSRY